MFLGLCNEVTLFVGEFAADNLDKVNEVAYTEYACGEKPDNAGTDFTYIEAVYSEAAEKDAENKTTEMGRKTKEHIFIFALCLGQNLTVRGPVLE